MNMSRDARVVAGITLIAVPTMMYGGAVLLGVLTRGPAGAVAISAGLFGLAFTAALAPLIYLGAAAMAVAVLTTGVGLLRRQH